MGNLREVVGRNAVVPVGRTEGTNRLHLENSVFAICVGEQAVEVRERPWALLGNQSGLLELDLQLGMRLGEFLRNNVLQAVAPLNGLLAAEVWRLHLPRLHKPHLIRAGVVVKPHDGRHVRAADAMFSGLDPLRIDLFCGAVEMTLRVRHMHC